MSMPNYAEGVKSFGFPLIGSGPFLSVDAGRYEDVFFVSKNGSDSYNGKKPSAAKLTIQAAVNSCTADYGSYVFVGEGLWTEQVDITTRGIHLIGMGPGRTRIQPAASMTAGDYCTPTLSVNPTTSGSNTLGVEIANMWIGGNGGYSGLYIGDDSDGGANASCTYVHDCILHGANAEGIYGIVIRGGSYIKIFANYIMRWSSGGVIIGSGVTRTAFCNVISKNHIVSAGVGVGIQQTSNNNFVDDNVICDDYETALTYGVNSANITGAFAACGGVDNVCSNNKFCTTGTLVAMNAGDHASGNYKREAGNAALFVELEA